MASSNRHWPSMFKSKPCTNTTHHQWQHDINSPLISSSAPCKYPPGHGFEERTPEPKPRWNPRPEQIRILEAIFNSGMVNPPRDEIRKIRAQLQEYGQVGDANVFYWFQNRKSRSKHKQRHIHSPKPQPQPQPQPQPTATPPLPPAFLSTPSPSSSSSDKTSSEKSLSVIDLLNSPTASVNQPFFHGSSEFLAEPFYFPVQQQNTTGVSGLTQEFCFPDVSGVAEPNPSCLLSELVLMSNCPSKKDDDQEKMKQQQLSYTDVTPLNAPNHQTIVPPSFCVPSPSNDQLLQGGGPTKSTVFINDVCFEVGGGPFNVREAFGDDAVLIHSSGQPVLTNDWGVTVHPLHHGAFYYLLRPFTPSPTTQRVNNFHLI